MGINAITMGIWAAGGPGVVAPGWQLLSTETFNTDPAGKYSILSGSPSVSWDQTNSRLVLSNGTTQGFIAWNALGSFAGAVAFEIDVLFNSDSAARKHFGMFCASGASGINGYRLCTLDDTIIFLRWAGAVGTLIGTFISNATFTRGNTYTLRFERSSSNNWTAYINGSPCPVILNDTTYDAIRPGFFVYGCGVYINELRIYGYVAV